MNNSYQKREAFFVKLGKSTDIYAMDSGFYYAGVKKFVNLLSKKILLWHFFKPQTLSTEELTHLLKRKGLPKEDCDEFMNILESSKWKLEAPLRNSEGISVKIFRITNLFDDNGKRYHKLTLKTHYPGW